MGGMEACRRTMPTRVARLRAGCMVCYLRWGAGVSAERGRVKGLA